MAVTLPDGRELTLTYPEDLDLEQFAIRPFTYGLLTIDGQRCGRPIEASYRDGSRFMGGDSAIKTYPGTAGPVELWRMPEGDDGTFNLVYHFDSWFVAVPDGAGCDMDDDMRRLWAENLIGREASDGLLILQAQAPVEIAPSSSQGSQLVFENVDGEFFELFSADCDQHAGGEMVAGRYVIGRADGFADWCIPDGSVRVQASGSEEWIDLMLNELNAHSK